MPEHCRECGAEIAARQRFCRRCGAPVTQAAPEEVPTKVFQPGSAAEDSPLTSPLSNQVTEPVYQQPTAYAPPPSARIETAHQATTSPRKSSSWLRFLPLILIGMVCLALLGGYLLALITRPAVVTVSEKTTAPPAAPAKVAPNHPPQPAAPLMSEEGATVTDEKTVITRTYPLGDEATVSLVNITGNVKIEGWDQPQAEVKVIKEGGSEQDRQAVQVKLTNRSDSLSIETAPTRSSPVEVHYELKLPAHVRQLEIKSADSKVELSKMTGAIIVSVQGSSIELKDVSGSINTKIIQGDTKASINGSIKGPQVLKSVNGDIEVRLPKDIGADISAETIDGDIDVDEDLNLKVEERRVGHAVSGRIGGGGVPISIKTINGDIRIKQ